MDFNINLSVLSISRSLTTTNDFSVDFFLVTKMFYFTKFYISKNEFLPK
jgi:hypothetical protein